MQNENKLFEDFAKVMNGVAGTVAGMGREAEASLREKMREFVGSGADAVSRDEFEVVKALAGEAREQAAALAARVAVLEAAAAAAPASPARKPATGIKAVREKAADSPPD